MLFDAGFKGKPELPRPKLCIPEHSNASCHRLKLSVSDVNKEKLVFPSWAKKQLFYHM